MRLPTDRETRPFVRVLKGFANTNKKQLWRWGFRWGPHEVAFYPASSSTTDGMLFKALLSQAKHCFAQSDNREKASLHLMIGARTFLVLLGRNETPIEWFQKVYAELDNQETFGMIASLTSLEDLQRELFGG